MSFIILINKPYNVLSQFTDGDGRETLQSILPESLYRDFYPAGRLDRDSEGLLVLTNDGALQARIADPRHKLPKTYYVEVEGIPTNEILTTLARGIQLKDGLTLPAQVHLIDPPQDLWPRDPPVRQRKAIPTQWLELTISEGRNRQVRRMTAAIGHPTLRLIRQQIGPWRLDSLQPGQYRKEPIHLPKVKGSKSRPSSRKSTGR